MGFSIWTFRLNFYFGCQTEEFSRFQEERISTSYFRPLSCGQEIKRNTVLNLPVAYTCMTAASLSGTLFKDFSFSKPCEHGCTVPHKPSLTSVAFHMPCEIGQDVFQWGNLLTRTLYIFLQSFSFFSLSLCPQPLSRLHLAEKYFQMCQRKSSLRSSSVMDFICSN